MTYPSFSAGEVLRAQDMNAVGMWLVKQQTVGTGVTSVTVTGAFSADYDAYKIVYTGGTSTNTTVITLRFGSVVTNYYFTFLYTTFTNSGALADTGNNTTRFTYSGALHTVGSSGANIEVVNPFNSGRYTYISNPAYAGNGTYAGTQVGTLADTSSFTSFILGAETGTMTGGTISVYGYKK